MNSCVKVLVVCALCTVCGCILPAQESSTSTTSTIVRNSGMERMPRVVTGMPYSSETVTETVQIAADGTRFDRKMGKTKNYRDSQGRTRMEHYIETGPSNSDQPALATVRIEDPVAGVSYSLNPREHVARQITFRVPHDPNSSSHVAMTFESRRVDDDRPHPTITTEDLGTQVIDGVAAEGKRTTMTFPANAEGNDKPFDRVTERWFSQELKIYVLIKNSDPRSGENTIKTTITSRAEPDPALFQVPADYTIEQNQQ
jgi:hypothetical protein